MHYLDFFFLRDEMLFFPLILFKLLTLMLSIKLVVGPALYLIYIFGIKENLLSCGLKAAFS